jgi:cytochrome c-type biogenesis protein CcmH
MKALLVALMMTLSSIAAAADAPSLYHDPATDARLNALATELRCLVCQNQSIADSHSELASDLRAQILDMIAAGKSDREIVDFMVARYGDFVLYNPPLKTSTALLWAGPALLLVLGLYALVRYFRNSGTEDDP